MKNKHKSGFLTQLSFKITEYTVDNSNPKALSNLLSFGYLVIMPIKVMTK